MNAYLQQAWVALEAEGCEEISPASGKYNCIAWAAGQQTQWWWPYEHPAYYWPQGLPRAVSLEGFFQAFATIGYQRCQHPDVEAGCEKVALYALDGRPTHAARQLADGRWTSKLGKDIDLTHTLRGLEGPLYDAVAGFLKRPISGV